MAFRFFFPKLSLVQYKSAFAGLLKDSRRLNLLLCCLGCLLQAIVVLKAELSSHSQVLYTLEQVFVKELSVLDCIAAASTSTACTHHASL